MRHGAAVRTPARRAVSSLRAALTAAVDRSARSTGRPAAARGRVLVVRLDAIGDFILWVEAAKALRSLYPRGERHVTLLANRAWAALAERQGIFDQVWPVDREPLRYRPGYRFRVLRAIRREGFETVIQPTYSREHLLGDAVVRASGAPERVGSTGDLSNTVAAEMRTGDGWYTRLVPADPGPLMELIRNAEFVRGLGAANFRAGPPSLSVDPDPPAGFTATRYYVLVPGAGWDRRQWPVASFAAIARRIHEATGWTGIACGGSADAQLGEALANAARVPIENWAGRTSLAELAAIAKGARLLFGNETGAVHLAAAVSTPAVSVTGGGHFGRFIPYRLEVATDRALPVAVYCRRDCFGCNWRCTRDTSPDGPVPCIAEITVEEAWRAVEPIVAAFGR
jgi:ADP-heptose:LPS heptosyltransferase